MSKGRRHRPARRSCLVAAALSLGAAVGLVAGMVATEKPRPVPAQAGGPDVAATDPFGAGGPATPPSRPPAGDVRQTITSAS